MYTHTKHHYVRKEVKSTNIRIVHEHVYIIKALALGDLGQYVNYVYLCTNMTPELELFLCMVIFIGMYFGKGKGLFSQLLGNSTMTELHPSVRTNICTSLDL